MLDKILIIDLLLAAMVAGDLALTRARTLLLIAAIELDTADVRHRLGKKE